MGQVHYLHRSTPPPFTVIEGPKDYAEHARIASVIAETRKYRWTVRFEIASICLAVGTLAYFMLRAVL